MEIQGSYIWFFTVLSLSKNLAVARALLFYKTSRVWWGKAGDWTFLFVC